MCKGKLFKPFLFIGWQKSIVPPFSSLSLVKRFIAFAPCIFPFNKFSEAFLDGARPFEVNANLPLENVLIKF